MIEAPILINVGLGTPNFVGARTIGGCVFDSCLGQAAFWGIASKNPEAALKAMALDAATAKGEIGGELGRVSFRVKEASYIDKVTNQQVIQKSLVSDDFGGKTISEVTDAGEYNTGTKEEYRRIVDRANLLSQTEGDASMFWVSPGKETNGDSVAHRASLLIKHGDKVVEYWFSLTGSKDSLERMMGKLGYQDEGRDELLEEQTIIRKGEDSHLSRQEVFHAHVASLTVDESNASKQFIVKLQQEVELPDEILEKRLLSSQKHYEAEIKKRQEVYKNDIKQALESIAVGLIALPEFIEKRESYEPRTTLDGRKMVRGEASSAMEERFIKDIIPLVPAIIFITDKINVDSKVTRDILTHGKDGKKEANEDVEITTKQITKFLIFEGEESLRPHTSGHVILRVRLKAESRSSRRSLSRSLSRDSNNNSSETKPEDDQIQPISYSLQDMQGRFDQDMTAAVFLEDLMEIYAFPDLSKTEERGKMKVGLQAVLEFIAQAYKEKIDDILQQKGIEDLSIQALEDQVVEIGKKILAALFDEHGKLPEFSPDESFSKLSFLISVYNEKEIPAETKQLVAVLIYLEIKRIYVEKLFTQLPVWQSLEKQIVYVFAKGAFFEKILEAFTFEKLPNIAKIKKRKQAKKFPKSGIIYHRASFVIYQYQPLVIHA